MILKWKRVGYHYNIPDLDIGDMVDMDRLHEAIEREVGRFLVSTFGLRVTVRVDLDGGPHRDLPFGYGTVVVPPLESGDEPG